jgi:hypothetical protein
LAMLKKTNQPKETMNKIEQIIINELPNTTPVNDQKRIIDINKIDVAYRELEDNDNQYEIMKFILSCLSDQQIKDTKKLVKVLETIRKKITKS